MLLSVQDDCDSGFELVTFLRVNYSWESSNYSIHYNDLVTVREQKHKQEQNCHFC